MTQYDERRFCPRDDVYVDFGARSKRKIVILCHYSLNMGWTAQKVDLASQVTVSGNVHGLEEKK